MLKKSILSPAQPRRAGTRLSPGFVLASLKASTYELGEGKVRIRSHMIEASGSSEAWYVPPRPLTCRGRACGKHASWRAGVGRVRLAAFLNILQEAYA